MNQQPESNQRLKRELCEALAEVISLRKLLDKTSAELQASLNLLSIRVVNQGTDSAAGVKLAQLLDACAKVECECWSESHATDCWYPDFIKSVNAIKTKMK